MEQKADDGSDKVEASKDSVQQTSNSPESGAWSRGQVLEAVLNVQMDFDVSKKQWDKNKEQLLEKIGSGQSGPEDVNSQMQLAQLKGGKPVQRVTVTLAWLTRRLQRFRSRVRTS